MIILATGVIVKKLTPAAPERCRSSTLTTAPAEVYRLQLMGHQSHRVYIVYFKKSLSQYFSAFDKNQRQV